MTVLFDTSAINASLHAFQQKFSQINHGLTRGRDEFTTELRQNIIDAYTFLNEQLKLGIRLFSPAGLHIMLELNHIVLCGCNSRVRLQYHSHVLATRARFLKNITKTRSWVLKKHQGYPPRKLAVEFYFRAISQPQLFIEGNHRTENIIMNYILVSKGANPFIISPDTAHRYLELSGDMKFTEKENPIHHVLGSGKRKKELRKLIEQCESNRYVSATNVKTRLNVSEDDL